MHTRVNRIHPAFKHGAYSATAVLPGENRAAFEKLHRALIAELTPSGLLEEDIVADMARLVWRKQNLWTLRIAERAQRRWSALSGSGYILDLSFFRKISEEGEEDEEAKKVAREGAEEELRVAQDQLRKELGDTFELVEIGEAATFDGLESELDIRERLDALIEKCVKRLLLVRGLKSVSAAPASEIPRRVPGPSKAA